MSKVEKVKLLMLNNSGIVNAAESSYFIECFCRPVSGSLSIMQLLCRFTLNYHLQGHTCTFFNFPPEFQWLVFKSRPLTYFPSMRWAISEGKEIISAPKTIF